MAETPTSLPTPPRLSPRRCRCGRSMAISSGLAPRGSAARLHSPGSCSATWSTNGIRISRQDYLDGLALAQLAPGPLAAQLAMYLGYVRAGVLGATIVSFCFVLPSFLMVWALSIAYVRFGGLSWMQALFYGVGAAVIAIIARSVHKLTRLTLGRNITLWTIASVVALTTAWTEREIIWLFLLAGAVTATVAGWRARREPSGRHDLHGTGPLRSRVAGSGRTTRAVTLEYLLVVCQSRCVRVRQRPGDCAVPLRRAGRDTAGGSTIGSSSMRLPSR